MNELGREAKALIELSREMDDPSMEDRRRVRHRLEAAAAVGLATAAAKSAGATTLLSGGTGATTAAVGSGKVAALLVSGLVAGFAATGAVALAMPDDAPRAAEPTSAHRSSPVAETRRAEASAEKGLPVHAEPPAPPPEAVVPVAGPRPVAAAPEPSALLEETRLLEGARSALARGDAGAALLAVDDHAARFPGGVLREEARATRVFALCGLGRVDEARSTATEFLRAHPTSALRSRVISSCAKPHAFQ